MDFSVARRLLRSLRLPAAILAATACAPRAAIVEQAAQWDAERHGNCMAWHVDSFTSIEVMLSRRPRESGIRILAFPLHDVPVGPLANLTLMAAGVPVRATAFGGWTRHDLRGAHFSFNPRLLLRRHLHGFRLRVFRGGTEIYAVDLSNTAIAFQRLLDCDRDNLLGPSTGDADGPDLNLL